MYIQPNSTIQIMRGVPLTTGYRDTLYFASAAAQESWFTAKVVYTFNSQSYQRVNKNTCRVEINAESIYNCNYMRFKNTAFGSKWFYAFITSVEYVNNTVSEITYEIDILQTWHFDYVLGKCYVEREHTLTDVVGEHTLPEPVDQGNAICQSVTPAGFNEIGLMILFYASGSQAARITEGTFVGCNSYCYSIDDLDPDPIPAIQQIIDDFASSSGGFESLAGFYLAPFKFHEANTLTPHTETVTINRPTTISGFTPNNKKLLTYPYTYLVADSLTDSNVYRFEYFKGNSAPTFLAVGTTYGAPSIICAPQNYEMENLTNYTMQVSMGGYPQCAMPVDSYKQWMASNLGSSLLSIGAGAASMAAGAATSNPMMMIGGAMGMANAISKDITESTRMNTSRGSINNYANIANRSKDIYFKLMQVNYEKARALDDFFSRYGYECERVKIPNRNVRKRWTYTKTKSCVVKGNVPADDLERIAAIFDAGITFWTTNGDLGDYVMDDNGTGVG